MRVRPPTATEAARLPEPCYDTTIRGDGTLATPKSIATTSSLREVVQVVDDRILTFDPDEKDRAKAFMERGFLPPGTKRYKDRRFMFDRVFDYEARQRDVYEGTAQPLLKGLLDGFNATVFAYGVRCLPVDSTMSYQTIGYWMWQDTYNKRNRSGSWHYISHNGRPIPAD